MITAAPNSKTKNKQMIENNFKIHQILTGENAFYHACNYEEITRQEMDSMDSSKALNKPIYTYTTENKVWRFAKDIFSVIIFPIGLYRLIHSLAGKIIVPASLYDHADLKRKNINLIDEWKLKRISIEVDGYIIDATIMGKASTLGNGRWLLSSNGNCEFYEDKLRDDSFKHILSELNGNAIVFNYPGVGSSTGMPNRNAMAKAYCAMLKFLEDQENGIGAKEIIGYGHSIGGGVQGDALLCYPLKQDVKYCFVKRQTFSDLDTTVSHLMHRLLGFLVKVLGWNMSSVESSKKLKAPEIIMQTADVSEYEDISGQSQKIKDDGVIPAEASLAKKLLDDKRPFVGEKYFLGIPEGHNDSLSNPDHLVTKIKEMLKTT